MRKRRQSERTSAVRLALVLALVASGVQVRLARSAELTRPVPPLAAPSRSWDSGHFVEGTSTAGPWSWHARWSGFYLYQPGLAKRVSLVRSELSFGLGLPGSLEVLLDLPLGFALQSHGASGIGHDGPGIGDLQGSVFFSAIDAAQGGFGLLLGATAAAPTGDNALLLGEGGFSAEALVSLAFQILSSRASLNLAYRLRPSHQVALGSTLFEQDDDLIWRAGLRILRQGDLAWSIEAEGAIGVATAEGGWPGSGLRPVAIGGGFDFPVARLYRLGLFAMIGIAGKLVPDVSLGCRFSWQPVIPDEDRDGLSSSSDECPLLPEDRDGFKDLDGCPDLDNDQDGFPDVEDSCPNQKALSDFSSDGC